MVRIVRPEPIRLNHIDSHHAEPCRVCADAVERIAALEARITELEAYLRRLTATPELRRREWTFEEDR